MRINQKRGLRLRNFCFVRKSFVEEKVKSDMISSTNMLA